jgi:hypothetical protein
MLLVGGVPLNNGFGKRMTDHSSDLKKRVSARSFSLSCEAVAEQRLPMTDTDESQYSRESYRAVFRLLQRESKAEPLREFIKMSRE